MIIHFKRIFNDWFDSLIWKHSYDIWFIRLCRLGAFLIILSPRQWLEFVWLKFAEFIKNIFNASATFGKRLTEHKIFKQKYKLNSIYRLFF